MEPLVVSALEIADNAVELVERKGLGHPDTFCDALAETLSRNLCREYRRRCGGRTASQRRQGTVVWRSRRAGLRGGAVLAPINIFFGWASGGQMLFNLVKTLLK